MGVGLFANAVCPGRASSQEIPSALSLSMSCPVTIIVPQSYIVSCGGAQAFCRYVPSPFNVLSNTICTLSHPSLFTLPNLRLWELCTGVCGRPPPPGTCDEVVYCITSAWLASRGRRWQVMSRLCSCLRHPRSLRKMQFKSAKNSPRLDQFCRKPCLRPISGFPDYLKTHRVHSIILSSRRWVVDHRICNRRYRHDT